METAAFDTSDYASRLAAAGETMEIASIHPNAIDAMRQAIVVLDAKVERYHAEDHAEFALMRAQLSELDAKISKELVEQRALIAKQDAKLEVLNGKLAALETKIDAKLAAMDAKFDQFESRMDAKLSALEKRLMRWILAVGVALGLFQSALAIVPRYLG